VLVFVFSGLVVVLDQFFKRWIVRTLEVGEQMDLIPSVIGLTHLQNTGAAFGLFAGQRWPLAAVAFVACVILVFILLRYTEGFWGTLGLAAVLGGAIGNLIDRVIFGYVVDMFQTLFIQFAIFNIADIFITLGFITFCVHFISTSIKQSREEKEAFDADLDDSDYYDDYDEEQYENIHDEPFVGQHDEQYAQSDVSHEHEEPFFDEFSNSSASPTPIDAEPDLDEIAQYMPEAQNQDAYMASSYSAPLGTKLPPEANTPETVNPAAWLEYYESAPSDENGANTLDALNSLEAELSKNDDYDVDTLLREYGFETSSETDK